MQIETKRLILREFKRDDWKDVQGYASDPEVVRYMEWGPNAPDQTKHFIDQAISSKYQNPRRIFEFAVMLKDSCKLIGACGLRILAIDKEQADIGYCYHRHYWRQGYASESCKALLQFGFGQLQLHRIFATCNAKNQASAAVLNKAGMRQEAYFKEDKKVKGIWRDTLLFAILSAEWASLTEDFLNA